MHDISDTAYTKGSARDLELKIGNSDEFNFKFSIVLFLILFLTGSLLRAQDVQETRDYYLKALFIFNSANYIDWGSQGKDNEFDIGILGSSPIAQPLAAIAASEMAGNKKIVIHQFKYPYEISFTNILFIARNYAFPVSSFLSQLAPGTLTVGEEDQMPEEGIAFNLVIDDNRLKYEANVKAIASAGLKASADLLQYAMVQPKELSELSAEPASTVPDMEVKNVAVVRDRPYPDFKTKNAIVVHDRDYPEGITEEIRTEPKMLIYRTVIRNKNSSVIFQKLVYDWGGIFYFRNNSSISETTYATEIKKAKDTLEKDKKN